MVMCAVLNCSTRSDRDHRLGVKFYVVPKVIKNQCELTRIRSEQRRALWIERINRVGLTEETVKTYTKVCSRHFITGAPAAIYDETNPDWAPSLYMGHNSRMHDTNDECEPFLKVDIKEEENDFEEEEEEVEKKVNGRQPFMEAKIKEENPCKNPEENGKEFEKCGHFTEIEVKNEQFSEGEEENLDIEVDFGSYLSTEIVKQDSAGEEVCASERGKASQWECDMCHKAFGLQFLLAAHKRIHAQETKRAATHLCDVCNKAFVQASALKEHRLVHARQKPFACPQCPCWFPRLYALHVHMRTHEQRSQAPTAEQHRKQRGRSSRSTCSNIQCEYCGRGFTAADALKTHVMRVHGGQRLPYECATCERRFTRMSGLSRHRAVHAKDQYIQHK